MKGVKTNYRNKTYQEAQDVITKTLRIMNADVIKISPDFFDVIVSPEYYKAMGSPDRVLFFDCVINPSKKASGIEFKEKV